jgi:uncharacterized protein YjbI with pentapeptide repeats
MRISVGRGQACLPPARGSEVGEAHQLIASRLQIGLRGASAEQRTRTLNERFATAAEQLGSDKPAVQLAGVYAMAGLADDWPENRRTCADVLCAYLRMPYAPDPGQDAPEALRLAFQAIREVRHTVIRVIAAHLKTDAAMSWQGLNFDFTGVVFDGADFRGAQFSGGDVRFNGTEFSGGTVHFNFARFSGGTVNFSDAEFSGGLADFSGAGVPFGGARFTGSQVDFGGARFTGGKVDFSGVEFSGGKVEFSAALFSGGKVKFGGAQFSEGEVYFGDAEFSGGDVDFGGAQFSGASVYFGSAKFSGGTVDFSRASDWSFPPAFPWTDTPPSGVKLPDKEDQSQA